MVVDEVKTELGLVQLFGKITKCKSELAVITGPAAATLGDASCVRGQKRCVSRTGRQRRVETRVGDGRHLGRLSLKQTVERIIHPTLHVWLAEAAKANHRVGCPRAHCVLETEVAP